MPIEMKALLDTNIIIHREVSRVANQDIGILFRWLDRAKYTKCIHPVTIQEIQKHSDPAIVKTFLEKIKSYEQFEIPAPLHDAVKNASNEVDINENDRNDSPLLNEVYVGRTDILITEDRKMHRKAILLGISDKVFTIDRFLEKIVSEDPNLANYKVLNVQKTRFGHINLADEFFTSFKEDYPGFEKWFIKKTDEIAYVTTNS